MLKAQWLAVRASVVALCGCAASSVLADSAVPADWNVTPLRNGAYTETFSAIPDWVNSGSVLSLISAYSITGVPGRANDWFPGATGALTLDTEGETITNTLKENNDAVPATADNPAYIDMLVRFDTVDDIPDADVFTDAKLALYAADTGSGQVKLVCWANNAYYTNSVTTDTNVWNRVTVKLYGTKFNVLLNDAVQTFKAADGSTSVTEFTLASGGTLTATAFNGTGNLANLYVGHCDPKYAVAGATTAAAKSLSTASQTDLGAENLTRVNKWLADNNVAASTGDDAALKGYLAGANGAVESATLSIASMDVLSPTQVKVTVTMTVNGAAKAGTVNGKLRLMGKVAASDAAFTQLTETAIDNAAFTEGTSAEYTFTVPTGGYHIFKPVISMQ